MAGSDAEERIRAKAVALLRRLRPAARIIHELPLEQGGVRIDLAAVAPDEILVAEIKSERDTLARTRAQIARAVQVADQVLFIFAAKHAPAVRGRLMAYYLPTVGHVVERNPDRIPELARCRLYVEEDEAAGLTSWPDRSADPWPDPRARFDLLWAAEQRAAVGLHFGGAAISSKATRSHMARTAVEHMTGRELRLAVCAQLRRRHFPRADPPVE